jgi:hypothetical protein
MKPTTVIFVIVGVALAIVVLTNISHLLSIIYLVSIIVAIWVGIAFMLKRMQ